MRHKLGFLLAVTLILGPLALVGTATPAFAACGSGETMTVTLSNSSAGNGPSARAGSNETLTATATDGNALSGAPSSVTFYSDGDARFNGGSQTATVPAPPPPSFGGTYSATVNPGSSVGTQHIFAKSNSDGCTGSATLTQFGPAATAAITLNPTAVNVNGACPTSAATLTVRDASGNGVADETVAVSLSNPKDTASPNPATNAGGGVYTTTIQTGSVTSSSPVQSSCTPTPPGRDVVTMNWGSAAPATNDAVRSASATLIEYGPPVTMSLAVNPGTTLGDGVTGVNLTAVPMDSAGNGVPGDAITFSSSAGGTFGPYKVTTDSTGTARTTFTPQQTNQTTTVTLLATDSSSPPIAIRVQLQVLPGPASLTMTLNPPSILPNGQSTTTANIQVFDATSHPVAGAVVKVTRSANSQSITATDLGNGTYQATLASVTTPQKEVITATTENGRSTGATLNETGQAALSLSLSPSSLPADGKSRATVTAVFTQGNGAPVSGQAVTFATSGDAAISPASATTDASGTAVTTVTASTTVGTQTITARSGSFNATATLTQTQSLYGTSYFLVASDGGIFTFGGAGFRGSTGGSKLNKPIVGMAQTPSGQGYWLVASDGGIFTFGDATFFGSTGAIALNKPIVGMATTPTGAGYWLVASDGGIFSFGDAKFYGSTGAITLNKPIVGMASSHSGHGYWMVASDGGIFGFGDAPFLGSTGGTTLSQPVVGMAPTATGGGYWFVAADGGIFSFGDATFKGSTGGTHLNKPIVGMAATNSGGGYWLVASDGGIFNFGDALFEGSAGSVPLTAPIVGMAGS